ncbi:MAG: radical SAM family heme chaperone HemW [Betaproteobacteria bacterium]|nr:radical SAM family heme chaperone HemW [Betaproteobacteria bacterium]
MASERRGLGVPFTTYRSPRFAAPPPLALYIHIPWCVRKCPYCDFNSHEARTKVPEQRYISALVADLEHALPQVWGRPVHSVFFGGGTPSLFSAEGIDAILAGVRARVPLAPGAEVTLEANPGTFEAEKFRNFRAAGVNRLSIGVQSFNSRHLRALGRIHGADEARQAIDAARRHFENFNLDIMYGLPAQSVEDALADVAEAIRFVPPHLSVYQLTIEPNTYFYRHPPFLPDDDATAAMQETIEQALSAANYEHYEVSAYARLREETGERRDGEDGVQGVGSALLSPLSSPRSRQSARCAHNLNYWMFGDYLGIGAGAHSKLSFADRIVRQMRVKHPAHYLEAAQRGTPVQEEHVVAADEIGFEFLMNALRLSTGFPAAVFEERTGMPLAVVLRGLDEAERRGLLARDHARIAPTPLGQRFLNDLLQLFLPPAQRVPHAVT